jgi:hypothetical protein
VSNNVYDIREQLAEKTAAHIITLTEEGEAGLTARLSAFPDDHVKRIMYHARRLTLTNSTSAT